MGGEGHGWVELGSVGLDGGGSKRAVKLWTCRVNQLAVAGGFVMWPCANSAKWCVGCYCWDVSDAERWEVGGGGATGGKGKGGVFVFDSLLIQRLMFLCWF